MGSSQSAAASGAEWNQVFMNGESRRLPAQAMRAAVTLADRRALEPASRHDAALVDALYDWYCSGYLCLR
jgi:hypothetical protein